ncbi:hypothetical protein J132_08456 [Termitomyces sp. J132]|nr:hypothetical protein J132_08456 [Termitomyces sp. J132]
MLYYDQGSLGNSGLYYNCRSMDGSYGLFMFLKPSPTPQNCQAYTMHTWSRSHINPYKS